MRFRTRSDRAVALIDFDAGVASFSGGPPLPITKRDISDGQVTFEITSGARVLKFSGRLDSDRIVGTQNPAEGPAFPFSFSRLPSIAPPRSRVEAWQQDLDAVSTRFFRFDRSFDDARRVRRRVTHWSD